MNNPAPPDTPKLLMLDPAFTADAIEQMREEVRFIHECGKYIDIQSGCVAKTADVDIRGNTDRSWQRGTQLMLERCLLCPEPDGC